MTYTDGAVIYYYCCWSHYRCWRGKAIWLV